MPHRSPKESQCNITLILNIVHNNVIIMHCFFFFNDFIGSAYSLEKHNWSNPYLYGIL